ncbi:cyclic nucleotide-binding domain-containing protein [Tateyamaria sp. Alg231-49]|uniref:cyclic nucleotide-binding domain-containing protein n=1 Tax=Tateyamaria sp. Alg231-49 TaxID=1922219 RepID=UPI00131F21DE|nr:cyclic nucleotide-binding domain-containing protein [Tateyamaria sp. Alg231-49]
MFDNPYIALIFLGLFFRSAGFLVRDELMLRVLMIIGTFCDIVFYVLQSPSIWGAVMTNTVLVVINASLIIIIVFERSILFMTKTDRRVFEQFMTLSPGQFRWVNRRARWRIADRRSVLLQEGEASNALFFINAPTYTVEKQGVSYTAKGPAFVGEIMLLQGGVASATVVAPKGAIYAEWDAHKLRCAMRKNRSLGNALMARFGHDLADKVRYSVPLPQQKPKPAVAPSQVVREPATFVQVGA